MLTNNDFKYNKYMRTLTQSVTFFTLSSHHPPQKKKFSTRRYDIKTPKHEKMLGYQKVIIKVFTIFP